VDARGGYTVGDGRFDDLYHRNDVFLVDAGFSVTNSAAQRFRTISLAMAACSGGETIMIAPGTYTETVTVSQNGITIAGSGQPYFDGTNLVGGTIIIGQINGNVKLGLRVRDLGVDVRTTGWVDAINSGGGSGVNAAAHGDFQNLICVGKGRRCPPIRGMASSVKMAAIPYPQLSILLFVSWHSPTLLR
jgi:hypothetical protein